MQTLTPADLKTLRLVPLSSEMRNRLRVVIAMAKTTQAELAALTGLTQEYISEVVTGRYKRIYLHQAQRLVRAFSAPGLTTDDVFPAVAIDCDATEEAAA